LYLWTMRCHGTSSSNLTSFIRSMALHVFRENHLVEVRP
jgi:hypothetical protein